jgi:GT2 family glycosyltransferase
MKVVESMQSSLPYECRYFRHPGGTAIQRNYGIDRARGKFIAFVDDDIRLHPGFFDALLRAFAEDAEGKVGGIVGYRSTDHFRAENAKRWRWYRRLGLLTTFEPGRYDFESGYPINQNMQPPFHGTRPVDFMTTSCALWRREVFGGGLRFDEFFRDFGVLEDAHLSLTAGQKWKLLQCGDATCDHLHASGGRTNRKRIGYKSVVNYYYVFSSIAGPLRLAQRWRFWQFQVFELFRIFASGVVRLRLADFGEVIGRLNGFWAVAMGRWKTHP